MVRIKKRKQKFIWIYLLAFLFILLIIYLFTFGIIKIDISKIINFGSGYVSTWFDNNTGSSYYTNSIVSWTWKIIFIPYDIQVWTNYKINFNNNEFFAKSYDYLLKNYIWKKIYFSWQIIWFSPDNIPVIDITHIKSINLEEDNNFEEIKENENRYLSMDWIIIDLENYSTWYEVVYTSWMIFINKILWTWSLLSWEGEKISYLKIVPFECSKWNPIYDCDQLKKQFELYKFFKVVNNNWIIFYKLPEVNQYEAFNEEYGYVFYPLTWKIYDLINVISFDNVLKKKNEVIKNTCKNEKFEMSDVLNQTNSWDIYTVVGFDKNSNKIICRLRILNTDWIYIWKLIDISFYDEKISNDKLDENNYLVYTSRWYGYKLYMPKWIKFESELVNDDFWISGLNCLQVVKITDWKNWTLEDPNVKVYYCNTSLIKKDITQILKNQLSNFKVLQKNWKIFIIIYKTSEIATKIVDWWKIY